MAVREGGTAGAPMSRGKRSPAARRLVIAFTTLAADPAWAGGVVPGPTSGVLAGAAIMGIIAMDFMINGTFSCRCGPPRDPPRSSVQVARLEQRIGAH